MSNASNTHPANPKGSHSSPYLCHDGAYDLRWIRARAETRAAARDYSIGEMLAEEMFTAKQSRENHFGPLTVSAEKGSPQWYRELSIVEAEACGDECAKPYNTRDLFYAHTCFERAESYAKRADDLDWQNAAPALSIAAE